MQGNGKGAVWAARTIGCAYDTTMDFNFTEEQNLLREAFAEFAKEKVAPNAARWDEEDVCPVELMPELGEIGILGVFVPELYGGVGLGHIEKSIALEEISRYSAGLAMLIFTHQLGMAAILDFGTEEQKQKYLPAMCAGKKICGLAVTEPGGGSDVGGQKTTIENKGDHLLVNGRKCFITNSHIADATVLTGKSGEDEKGRAQLSVVIIEKGMEGFAPGRKENKLGLRGSVTGELLMNNVKMPLANLLGNEGQGNAIIMKELGEVGRASMTAISLGIIRGCLEESVKFANQRIIYGKPSAKLPAIQFHIAENRVDYEATKVLLYRAAALKDQKQPSATEFSVAKLFATEAAVRAAKRTIESMGGYGYVNEYPVGRYLRDAMGIAPSCGTNEIQKIIIAGDTIKKYS